jgi:hypothetical protein
MLAIGFFIQNGMSLRAGPETVGPHRAVEDWRGKMEKLTPEFTRKHQFDT